MIKAVFSDLDGTLLNSKHEVSNFTVETVKKLKEKNIKFFIATGRSLTAMLPYYEKLGLDTEIISYNGGVVYNNNFEKIFEMTLDDAISRELIKTGREKNLYFHGFSNEKWLLENYSEMAVIYKGVTSLKENIVNFDELKELNFNKFMYVNDEETTQKMYKYIADRFGKEVYYGLSKPMFLEIMNPNVSKGKAVKFVLEKYNLLPEETMAFGDAENDLDMLSSVKYGTAMSNSKDDVKSHSKYITDHSNEEDGVAKHLKKFLEI